MCDETTGLTRRAFAAGGAAVLAGGAWSAADAQAAGLSEAMVEMNTQDGTGEAFFVHPANGRHPGVVFWPDAIGLREAKMAMARRLAASGYAVLAVNQYYRNARLPLDISFADFGDPERRARLGPLIGALTSDAVTRDARAYVAFLDRQASVDTGRGIGTQGYCMGGGQAIRTAAAVPERVKAVASFHGGGLVTDAPDSPHRIIDKTQAAYLILPGRDDDAKEPGAVAALRQAATAAGRPAEIEVYAADHGWCVPDAPAYDKAEADRAWQRLLALYAAL
jgi:carboxymethylenebutenolidase